MSQPNTMNQGMPNGVPAHLNGIDSSHSSRDSSPSTRMHQQIPNSQLPSMRPTPQNQLPPMKNQLNSAFQVTPVSSPKVQQFTSTPIVEPIIREAKVSDGLKVNFNQSNVLSPITTSAFTHSATSHFSNVPLSGGNPDPLPGNTPNESGKPAQIASQRLPSQNVPSEIKQNLLPHQNSLPTSSMPSKPLQPSLSQPRLMAYNNQPTQMTANGQSVTPNSLSSRSTPTQPNIFSMQQLAQSVPNISPNHQFLNKQNVVSQGIQQYQNSETRSLSGTPTNLIQTQQFGSQNFASMSQNNMQKNINQPLLGQTQSVGHMNQPYTSPQAGVPTMNQGWLLNQAANNIPTNQFGMNLGQQNKPMMNMPPNSKPNMPPMAQSGISPMSQSGIPPMSQSGIPSMSQSGVPPMSQSGIPPISQSGIAPMNQSGLPSMSQTSTPSMNQSGMSLMGQNNVPLMTQTNIPPIGQTNMQSSMPPIGQTNMPSVSQANRMQSGMPPGLNQPNVPFMSHPGMQQQRPAPPQMGQQQQVNYPFMQNTTQQIAQARPTLTTHTSMGNLYQKQLPPKTNSLPGPQENANMTRTNVHANRYATQQYTQQFQNQVPQQQTSYQNYPQQQYQQQQQQQTPYNNTPSVAQVGFNKLWGADNFDLLQTPTILPPTRVETPRVSLGKDQLDQANCSPDIFRCTMTKIPENNSLLQKSRLPLGVLIHPFKDLNHLPVIQCNTIVRCRACRTYINPFVFFVDQKRWKCNLCYRVNELPEEFQYDPVTKTYGDPSRRPEVRTSTIEYIAPAEYMLRPPQPAVYLFLLDISRAAIESGYLHTVCSVLNSELANLPGDTRTHIGFIAYDSALHFFSLADGLSQPHEMTVLEIDDIFLPCPDNLLVNLQDRMELISDLLTQLPNRYNMSYDTGSAMGAALQAAHKMMSSTGGRVTVFQSSLPTVGPGALIAREDPSQRASSEAQHLNPANDFYKRLALECSGQQIAVDLFLVNSQYIDLATLSGISRFSGGCMYHFPLFKLTRNLQNDGFERSLRRYLTRKIGFEAVMRIRCTRGLSIHTFHGNFFVRSTDLLSLPNVNPDAGFGMQVAIEESLSDVQTVCFQAALLYTSSKGERRIRVHTMCLPIASNLTDVINSADQQCIVGLLAKMAVDRSMQSSLSDARDAFINVAIDILSSYKLSQNMGSGMTGLLAPRCLRLLPLYISALLKSTAFRSGVSTRLDDRVKAMCDMKTRPLPYLIQQIYADLYPIHNLQDQVTVLNDDEEPVHMPPHLQLTARSIDSNGSYLLDTGDHMIIIICPAVSPMFLNQVLGVSDYNSVSDQMYELPVLENEHNQKLHMLINYLNDEKPMNATLQIMRDNSPLRTAFIEKLIEDRVETALSYHEFLQHLKTQVK